MEDKDIINLYWSRNENAINETSNKYGNYCFSIAHNILSDFMDAEESVNDTYLATWNSIPPHKPSVLSAFLGKITRRISLKKWRDKHAQKRGGGQTQIVLDELLECIPSNKTIDDELNEKELADAINIFISNLDVTERRIFICRYWYLDSIADISKQFGYTQSKIKTTLFRTRGKLLSFLKKEGVFVEIE